MSKISFVDFVLEKQRAETLHPEWPENVDRQVAIMVGEAGEALRCALHYVEGRDTEGKDSLVALREELIQTGAMVLRCLEHLPKE